MRTRFIKTLIQEARLNKSIFLIVGDLGYSVVEEFREEFPDRFLNVGIAEQNMIGIAAGLAAEGFHVFVYSIANFPTLRCLEQIRNDVCYHNLSVTIVSVGAGLAYGNLGYSHHAIQDIACFRTLPNCTILSPADPGEAANCVKRLSANPGPSYLRLGKAGEEEIYENSEITPIPNRLRGKPSSPVCVAGTGSVVNEAVKAADMCQDDIAVYSIPWISPATSADLAVLWKHKRIITIEEHVSAGGIGEWISACRLDDCSVRAITIPQNVVPLVGSQVFLLHSLGLDATGIKQALREHMRR